MAAKEVTTDIAKTIDALKEKQQREYEEALKPARKRLQEIAEQRAALDEEERKLRALLGLSNGEARQRRRSGKRMTALHKKEILSRFIRDGHIKSNMQLSKELRAALSDEGLGNHDFRKLDDYMPQGWEARSNGMRGPRAETIFYKVS